MRGRRVNLKLFHILLMCTLCAACSPPGQHIKTRPYDSYWKNTAKEDIPIGPDKSPEKKKRMLIWPSDSESVGKPDSGYLVNSIALPNGRGYRHVGTRPFGTAETLSYLIYAVERVIHYYPDTADLIIGDISKKDGGKAYPHKSHQSGRDADIGYYHKENTQLKHFEKMTEETLDAEKTWILIESLIMTGAVEYIFVNYDIEPILMDAALDSGWSERDLNVLFRSGDKKCTDCIIRSISGHKDHFHIRFRCPLEDMDCQ